MSLVQKIKNRIRGLTQRWGSFEAKKALWNKEFAEGKWDFLDNTSKEPIYDYIKKYCAKGSILDMGCGAGNTGCELDINAYSDYTGVDISDVAIGKAIKRSKANQREEKNHYGQGDIALYTPTRKHDVILFRESIYYIHLHKLRAVLDRYSQYLTERGVFIFKCFDQEQAERVLDALGNGYTVLEQYKIPSTGAIIAVLRQVVAA